MNANIKFSREEEQNNQLPFLDVLVQRHGDGKINTSVYRKSSTSDIVLHYSSNHPTNHKRLCVKHLFDRARLYCSDKTTLTLERFNLLSMFRNCGIPSLLLGVQCDTKPPEATGRGKTQPQKHRRGTWGPTKTSNRDVQPFPTSTVSPRHYPGNS